MRHLFDRIVPFLAVCALFSGMLHADEWETQRAELLNRPRYFWNNDGGDLWHWDNTPVTIERAHARINWGVNVASKGITTYVYCPLCSAFCNQTNRTKAGDIVKPPKENRVDSVRKLHELGTDPLEIAQAYARKNKLEFFISLRMNDIHDVITSNGQLPVVFPDFKRKHPEYMAGSITVRPPAAPWSAVDYGEPEVRKRITECFREFCENYDADGIELDFTRDPSLFKSVAWGKNISAKEIKIMDRFMANLRAIAEETGKKRGRPILIALRIPNALDYCKAIGIDAEAWFAKKYADILVADNWMNYDFMENTFRRVRKYGVKCYAGVDNMAVRRVAPQQQQAIRFAMISDALTCGADGIYFFNWFNPDMVKNQMTQNISDLKGKSKIYYPNSASTDYLINRYLINGESFARRPILMSDMPFQLPPGQECRLEFNLIDDFKAELKPEVSVSLSATEAVNLKMTVNGTAVPLSGSRDKTASIPLNLLKTGKNVFVISYTPENSQKAVKHAVVLAGTHILAGKNQPPWRRFMRVDDLRSAEKIEDEAYVLTDSVSAPGCAASLMYPLADAGNQPFRATFEMKLDHTDNPLAAVFRIADKRFAEIISFTPKKINFLYAEKSIPFETDDDFHWYRVVMEKKHLVFYADGRERIRVPLVMKASAPEARLNEYVQVVRGMHDHSFVIGSISGKGKGVSRWKNIQIDKSGIGLTNFHLDIIYPEEPPRTVLPMADASPEWSFTLNTRNMNNLSGIDANSYGKDTMTAKDGALLLIHDSPEQGRSYQGIFLGGHPGLKMSGIFLAEWSCAVHRAGYPDNQAVFNLLMRPAAKDGTAPRENFVQISPAGIKTKLGSVKLNLKPGEFHTFRAALNPENGDFALWMDKKLIQQGNIPVGFGARQVISFGDLSGAVGGQALLKEIKITKVQ